ncbi:MAG: WYL domain-containing protein [Myxococcaceae bacterium]|nr:WYL domain-containing protein [Myxococcaceae bacterium]
MSGDTRERLKRLLFLVPYVARNPGISVEALARELGVSREDLLEELDLLMMVGRPPFQPDDYIDVRVENDRVWVDLDVRLSAPPRLTASEAVALAAAAELLRPSAGGGAALESALAKLVKVLPAQAHAAYREMVRKIDASSGAPTELAPLAQAIRERREVRFDYLTPSRGRTEARHARPLALFNHRGQWYLNAFDVGRGEDRLFRLDRLQGLTLTDERFQAPASAGGRVPTLAEGRGEVRVRFGPSAAPYVRERFGESARAVEGGGVEVTVPGDSEVWLVRWVLSHGGEAEVVAPAWAREAVARAARTVLGGEAPSR